MFQQGPLQPTDAQGGIEKIMISHPICVRRSRAVSMLMACAQGGQNKMKLLAEIYKVSEGDLEALNDPML